MRRFRKTWRFNEKCAKKTTSTGTHREFQMSFWRPQVEYTTCNAFLLNKRVPGAMMMESYIACFRNKKCMFKRAIRKLMTQAKKMRSMRKSPLNRYVSVKRHLSSSRKIQPKFFYFKTLSTSTMLYHPQSFIIHYPLLCFSICILTE